MKYSKEQIKEFADELVDRDFHNPTELVQYFLVNSELNMKKGKIAAQVAHAATINTYCLLTNCNTSDAHRLQLSYFDKWYHSIQKKIILKAPQALLEQFEAQGYIAIRDKGYTQILPDSLTVVTLGVLPRNEAPDCVKELSLL